MKHFFILFISLFCWSAFSAPGDDGAEPEDVAANHEPRSAADGPPVAKRQL